MPAAAAGTTEILWDRWGVPHIFAEQTPDLFYAFGWAQTRSHGNLLLRLMGQSRGRAAEYWGEGHLAADRWVHTMGIPERSLVWYQAQTTEWKGYLEAFAAGINDYASAHPQQLEDETRRVLPVEPTDILAHTQRVILFSFVTSPQTIREALQEWRPADSGSPAGGSNGWVVGPRRSASGNTLLLANPHLPWADLYLFYESHLVSRDLNAYGASLVGTPILGIAFNDHLGWTHTVNTHDGDDLYELELVGEDYRWEGGVRPLEKVEKELRVRMPDGSHRPEKVLIRHSLHGPIVGEKDGKALALRLVGLDAPGMLAQWWDMMRSRNLEQFEAILARLQIPMFTVLYGDRSGRILHFFGGLTPIRPEGAWNWGGVVPGRGPETLWTATYPYRDLPRALDPASGWLQNANDPPWTTTFPSVLEADRFPPYLAPRFMSLRAQRSASLLLNDESITFEEMIEYKHSSRMELADRVLEDLLQPARRSRDPVLREAAAVLGSWDRTAGASSRGSVLFEAFFRKLGAAGGPAFARRWQEDSPLATPAGLARPPQALAALASAAGEILGAHGRLDVEWGAVNRLRIGAFDLPANGGPGELGIFRVVTFSGSLLGQRRAVSGDSFVMAVEFSDPIRAQALLSYGNASQKVSPFVGDQLPLFARRQLRPVWRSRHAIERNLHLRETF